MGPPGSGKTLLARCLPGLLPELSRAEQLAHEALACMYPADIRTRVEAALENAGLQAHWAGLYEVTPDAHPIIGTVPALENYYVVTGFSGHGFMHGPIAGLLMAEIMLDGAAHTVDISSLAYSRFSADKLTKEYNVI